MTMPVPDPAIVGFVRVLAGVLAVALAIIATMSPGLRRRDPGLVREIWLRYASWLAIAALVVGALAIGRGAWIALVGVVSALAFREYARVVGLEVDPRFLATGYALIALIHASAAGGWYGLFTAMPALAAVGLFAVPVTLDRFEQMPARTGAALTGVICFGWLLGHFASLVDLRDGVGLVLFVAFLAAINDVTAFVVGRVAGRHPLRPTLSPRKTWEGVVGGAVVVVGAAWMLRWLVPAFRETDVIVVGVLVASAGTLGDLALATIKRDAGVKDWSRAIPGHGGLLDRLNSLVFSVPLCFHYIRHVTG